MQPSRLARERRARAAAVVITAACGAWSAGAAAQPAVMNPPLDAPPPPPTTPPEPPPAPETTAPAPAPGGSPAAPPGAAPPSEVEQRLRALEESNARLRAEVEQLKQDHAFTDQRVEQLMPVKNLVSGYVDFGFFAVQGNGSGIRLDSAHIHFPQYAGPWVFMGDPLATAINSRGTPASLGGSQAIQLDPIHNGGTPSFILNTLTLNLFKGIGDDLTLNGSIDFLAFNRDVSDPKGIDLGDYLDLKRAYADWILPTRGWALDLYAGKFDSVVGIEYRGEDSPDRIGVTPSLICRYTCGHPLGLKARARFFDERLVLNVAMTNGSNFVESFPFSDEIDTNSFKTVSGRLSYRFPFGGKGLELGVSGAYGAQDYQSLDSVIQYHFGADLHLATGDLDFQAEAVTGKAEGLTSPTGPAPCDLAPCLRYQGFYGQLGYRFTNWLMPYVRVDGRDALHQSGISFTYVSQLMRLTTGVHFEFGTNVIAKAEYTVIRELGSVPEIPDNVFTSSLVVRY